MLCDLGHVFTMQHLLGKLSDSIFFAGPECPAFSEASFHAVVQASAVCTSCLFTVMQSPSTAQSRRVFEPEPTLVSDFDRFLLLCTIFFVVNVHLKDYATFLSCGNILEIQPKATPQHIFQSDK